MLHRLTILFLLYSLVRSNEIEHVCVHREAQHPVLFVSRLDGIISAIELSETLPLLWEYDLGNPLLSTSNTLSLEDNSMLVPSLDGNLYSYNETGQSIQPYSKLETLLNKKPGPDEQSRWVGGKVITTIGIGPHDGKVYYKCNMDDCKRYNDSTVGTEPILAITSERKTVRLLDMKLGVESWNWSISTVEMQYIGVQHRSSCHPPILHFNMNFDVQNGYISVQFDNGVFSSTTLTSTLSQSWVLNDEFLHSFNMFYTPDADPNAVSIYVGQWNNILYIQPFLPHRTLFGVNRINDLMFQVGTRFAGRKGRSTISWESPKPISDSTALVSTTTTTSLIPVENTDQVWVPVYNYLPANVVQDMIQEVYDTKPSSYQTIIFYLFENSVLEKMISTMLVAGVIGFLLYRKILKHKPTQNSASTNTEGDSSQSALFSPGFPAPQPFNFDHVNFNTPFESRFEQDFVIIKELGQGGFGKVLEAQHKISEHNYAIKVIKLPSRDDLKKKVEREVAAMAKLEHPNILRYYTSWKETPSMEWTRSRKYTSNSDSFDSGTSTKSTSPSYLRSPKTPLSKNGVFSPSYKSHSQSESSYNVYIDSDEATMSDSIVFKNSEKSDSIVFRAPSDQSESIVFRKSPSYDELYDKKHCTPDDDSLIVFEDSCSGLKRKSSKKPNLILPLHRKVVDRTKNASPSPTSDSTTSTSSDQSQSVRIPIRTSPSRSVTFSSWGDYTASRDVRAAAECEDESKSRDTSRSRDSGHAQTSPRQSFLYIQMQLCLENTLKEWLIDNTERPGLMDIFSQIVDAVEYIHSKNHIHRDLKPSNILFTEDSRVKVADFGLATVMSDIVPGSSSVPPDYEGPSLTQNLGTRLYMSPELESNRFYDYKVDIYALGIVFFELLMVFNTYMERVECITELRNKKTVPSNIKHPEHVDILLRMIATDPDDRPTASQIKSYFETMLFSNRTLDGL